MYQEILIDIPKLCDNFELLTLEQIINLKSYNELLHDFLNINNDVMEEEKFIIYSNEKNFCNYIKKASFNRFINFLKSKFYRQTHQNISLNIKVYNAEKIEFVSDDSNQDENLYLVFSLLNSEDIEFINCFISNGQVLSQKEVAEKLGMSQQTVSKWFNDIKKKIRDREVIGWIS